MAVPSTISLKIVQSNYDYKIILVRVNENKNKEEFDVCSNLDQELEIDIIGLRCCSLRLFALTSCL